MMGDAVDTVYVFADGRVDLRRRELYVRGQLADMQPLAFDVLAYFIANVGRVVSKDELLASVWGTSVGSDAMVARAVMKVRRAIGDSGHEPRLLKTVHRVGYRLDLEVRLLEAATDVLPGVQVPTEVFERATRHPIVIPCRNGTGDEELNWVEHGVPSLVQQVAGSDAPVMLPPADWLAAADPLASACDAVGATEAVGLELHRLGDRLRLEVRRGQDQASAKRSSIEGATVPHIVHTLSSSLTGGGASVGVDRAEEAFWEEQLARALDLERRGSGARALALMDECIERLTPTVQLFLAHAAMLRRMGRRDEAGKRARQALSMAEGDVPDHLLARALYEMATQSWHEMQPGEAARLAEEALAAAQRDPAGAAVIPDILSFYASISRERDDPVVSIRLAERAIAAAVALGNRAKESHARVVLGSALLHAGQTHRAADVLRRAADLGHRQRLVLIEAYALRTLALLDEQVGRYVLAIDEARRSAALAASCGNLTLKDSARVQEVVSLVHDGQLEQAAAVAERVQDTVDAAWENAYSLRYARALLAWRSGEGRSATDLMKGVADEGRQAGLRFANVARLEECFQLVSLGDKSAAQEALNDLERAGATVAVLQGRAALQLASNDRAGCVESLREAARAALLDSADSVQIDINLAWLLLEDGQWQEVGALVGNVAESLSERLPARILNAGYLLATNPRALADGEWETLISLSPKLMKACPWLLNSDAGDRLRAGILRPLPELLSRACW